MQHYITQQLKINEFKVVDIEKGEIPMYESEFVNIFGNYVTNIGISGGLAKPSSGYTFYFIQQHTNQISQKKV